MEEKNHECIMADFNMVTTNTQQATTVPEIPGPGPMRGLDLPNVGTTALMGDWPNSVLVNENLITSEEAHNTLSVRVPERGSVNTLTRKQHKAPPLAGLGGA